MEKTHWLSAPNDSDTEDLSPDELGDAQNTSDTQESLVYWRVLLDVLVVLCLGVFTILLIRRDYGKSKLQCIQHHLPVGSDLSGFVPPDISSRPTMWASGPDAYAVPAEAFDDLTVPNETIKSWKTLTNAFVLASPYDGRGPQIPFETTKGQLFEISAFHQIHCLVRNRAYVSMKPFLLAQTTIIEDFGLLQAGYSRDQLPGAHTGKVLTWAENKAHCFNYVRQALTCHADSTAEGHMDGNVHQVADHGVLHICNNFNALLEWAAQPERVLPQEIKIHS